MQNIRQVRPNLIDYYLILFNHVYVELDSHGSTILLSKLQGNLPLLFAIAIRGIELFLLANMYVMALRNASS